MNRILIPTLLLALPLAASAADWTVQPGSRLGFAGTSQGERFQGEFNRFDARIAFDPQELARSSFDVTIELASADSRNEERDDTMKGSDFFDVASHPTARYRASEFHALPDGRFEARGTLQLRDASQPVTLVFSWTPADGGATLEGTATLDRTAFGVGGGDWADASMIGHEVDVTTTLELAPAE